MARSGLPELLEAIEAASTECRTLIQQAHEAMQDLKAAIKEGQAVIADIHYAAKADVQERIDDAVRDGLETYKGQIREAMDSATKKVGKEFTRIANLHLYGNEQGRGTNVFQLATELAHKSMERGPFPAGD